MSIDPAPDLSVVIVNYNTAPFLRTCLESLLSQRGAGFEVLMVDNGSTDESCRILRTDYPFIELISNKSNVGFARANNLALKRCQGKYVYFLNPDTEVLPDCFSIMIAFMEGHPEVGLAGTCILNPDGSKQSSVERTYPGENHARGELKGLAGDIAWVLGASMIARKQVMEKINGFDETFFLYGEETDLCLRVRKDGWCIGYIPDAKIVHKGGGSECGSLPEIVWRKKTDSEFIFYQKHYSNRAVRSIKRANLIQAYWRILTIRLFLPFLKNRRTARKKLTKYRVVVEQTHLRSLARKHDNV